ncbi:MAG: ABC transporter permease [Pseudomonadales bacterium]|nr:ABC transporter permease [Pseudomonadales bacterium]
MNAYASWIAFSTLLTKEVRRFMRIWVQTLLPPAITMCLYFIIFGNLVGSRVGHMGGFDYMQFIVPGLIMMAVIQNSYANVVSSFYSAKFQRSIEELQVAPVSNFLILTGYVVGGVVRGLMVALIVTLLSLFFTHLHLVHPGVVIFTVVLTAFMFSLGGFINAIYAKSFDDISIVPTFVLTPLTYLGGVFYSVHLLSPFWQQVTLLNPIIYMVNAFRFGVLGVSDVPITKAMVVLTVLAVLLYGYALKLLHDGTGLRE